MDDEAYMRMALDEARRAAGMGEVPIGAVVVRGGEVLARACNIRETEHDPAGHAEFVAIEQAARRLGAWRLSGCTVYVTLEPCIMCAGLMHQARIERCVFGAFDPKAGALGTLYQVNADTRLNHVFEATGGVLQGECAQLLRDFFRARRKGRGAARAPQAGDARGSAACSAECGRGAARALQAGEGGPADAHADAVGAGDSQPAAAAPAAPAAAPADPPGTPDAGRLPQVAD